MKIRDEGVPLFENAIRDLRLRAQTVLGMEAFDDIWKSTFGNLEISLFFLINYNGFSPGISNRYLMTVMLIQLMFNWYRTVAWDVITSIACDL